MKKTKTTTKKKEQDDEKEHEETDTGRTLDNDSDAKVEYPHTPGCQLVKTRDSRSSGREACRKLRALCPLPLVAKQSET